MKTIATVLLAVAIVMVVTQGFSWIWLIVAIICMATIAYKAVANWTRRTFEPG